MVEFQANGRTITGYLATPKNATAPGLLVLHAWWGLTDFFKQVCERFANEGFMAFAPDLYDGKTATTVEEAQELVPALNSDETYQTITAAIEYLFKHPGRRGNTLGAVGFSMGGYWVLRLEDHIGAIVTFYGTTDAEEVTANVAFLGHFAEHDDFEPLEGVVRFEEEVRSSGREVSFYIYPGTQHWFFEENRPNEYNAEAARLAWERTIEFLHEQLG